MTEYSLPKTYDPQSFESETYRLWLDSRAFHAEPDDRPSYVIMMPLPNVTGALHMGHAMDNVMQDLLIRYHRMLGDNALWMPGTDHAGIATQAVVEKRLQELEGLTRHDVGREGLVERIWKWKDQFQARIVEQQQRMGCSADWQRQRFTMDAVCSRAVRHTFFRMFADGLIVRGKRLVNWDPFLRTSISDDEVYHETVQGHFWHLRYPVIDPRPGEPEFVVVATTRPETMLGDTAVAVHPEPDRALDALEAETAEALGRARDRDRAALEAQLAEIRARRAEVLPELMRLRDMAADGRQVMLPLMDRPIPLIADVWARPELGSGCVKITPAHDPNDYEVWTRHRERIAIINILEPDGSLNASAGRYAGLDRFAARDQVVADLDAAGLLGEVEQRQVEIGHSDRSKTPIEPYLSDQWFVRMGDVEGGVEMGRGTRRAFRSPGLVQAAMDAAADGRVRFHPERFVKTYTDWLSEKRDWPISRQLWWGHRIPVWSRALRFEELADVGSDLLEPLAAALGTRAALRAVRREDSASFAIACTDDLGALPGRQGEAWLLDACLLEDDPSLVEPLEARGFERDPDVLDTWFSSALWPHSTLGWPDPATAETGDGAPLAGPSGGLDCLSYYYPGSCLVTARDIITLWVARMVLTGLYNLGDVPFSDVFIHANILDGKGERMSKSKGNGIDPVDIIEAYGTDAMRYVLCDMQTGMQDIRLPVTAVCPACEAHNDLSATEHGRTKFTFVCASCQAEFDVLGTMPDVPAAKLLSERFIDGRKFCNKLWNTARFALGHLGEGAGAFDRERLEVEDRWILSALNAAVREVSRQLEAYNPSAALGAARDFMWGELCDWYLELVKPRLAGEDETSAATARRVLAHCLDQTLRLLHPFVPYISEHLFGRLRELVPERGLPGLSDDDAPELLIAAPWPRPNASLDDAELRETFRDLQAATSGVRELRSSRGVSPSVPLRVTLRPSAGRASQLASQAHVIERLANVEKLEIDPDARAPRGAASRVVGEIQIFVHDLIDPEQERDRLEKELGRLGKEIAACEKKLGNEKFKSRAPAEVVAEQRERLARYQAQKQAVERALAELIS
ncbi:MAG: valine--tRNA ligase [Deltaproteobacteria bacterium]|nr:valine--tRNA ligase [Deltaproteobacteria bacterium]